MTSSWTRRRSRTARCRAIPPSWSGGEAHASPWVALTDRRRIAVIPIRGVIGGAVKTADTLAVLERARTTSRIRAVVLDIDSPGGGATASEALYLAVRRLAKRKPVVAWFRGTGASGAYFLACGATRILAFPSAIVGSIGVIAVRPIAAEALRRLGARVMVTKSGPLKDLGAPWREPTEADEAKERELVEAIFVRFRDVVSDRRDLEGAALERVVTGEVWLGEQALELCLVDGICEDEDGALREAQRLAQLAHRQTVRLSPRRTLLQRVGVPGAGMGPPGPRWIAELEGWLTQPRARL
ncbi:MAG: signal peptide peptidase SppA [Candidatus Dormibacteria bacterium]